MTFVCVYVHKYWRPRERVHERRSDRATRDMWTDRFEVEMKIDRNRNGRKRSTETRKRTWWHVQRFHLGTRRKTSVKKRVLGTAAIVGRTLRAISLEFRANGSSVLLGTFRIFHNASRLLGLRKSFIAPNSVLADKFENDKNAMLVGGVAGFRI